MLIVAAIATAAPAHAQCSNSWLSLAPGANDYVRAMTSWDPDGPGPQPAVVVVAGDFSTIGGVAANGAAIFDPVLGTWSAMGLPQFAIVGSLAVMANGDLIGTVATSSSSFLARWNGSAWTPFAPGASGGSRLLPLPNGDLIVAGGPMSVGGPSFLGAARWNGATWSAMPGLSAFSSFLGFSVTALALTSNGDIVAGGLFTCTGGHNLARWDGAGWTSINPFLPTPSDHNMVITVIALPNDGLAVAYLSRVMQRDGATWSVLGTLGFASTLSVASNGDVIAGFGSPPGVARWNGSTWSTFGSGLNNVAYSFANLPNGDLLVGGNFTSAGGLASPNIARVTTSCPATVASYGAGCAGAGGPNVLSPVTLPWIGSTFRARAVGMPPLALVLSVYGFTPQSIPFASVFPQALPGCTILMNGDLIDVLLPNGGTVDTQIALPDVPAIVGAAFHHYVVPFEVDQTLTVTAITNSNALTCTLGAF